MKNRTASIASAMVFSWTALAVSTIACSSNNQIASSTEATDPTNDERNRPRETSDAGDAPSGPDGGKRKPPPADGKVDVTLFNEAICSGREQTAYFASNANYGEWALARFRPERYPFSVESVHYQIAHVADLGCSNGVAQHVRVFKAAGRLPPATPANAVDIVVPATPDVDAEKTIDADLPAPLVLEEGESLFVAVEMTGDPTGMTCLLACQGFGVPNRNYWSEPKTAPFAWESVDGNLRVKAKGRMPSLGITGAPESAVDFCIERFRTRCARAFSDCGAEFAAFVDYFPSAVECSDAYVSDCTTAGQEDFVYDVEAAKSCLTEMKTTACGNVRTVASCSTVIQPKTIAATTTLAKTGTAKTGTIALEGNSFFGRTGIGYTMSLVSGQTITIETSGNGATPIVDTWIYLFDPNGKLVAHNDDADAAAENYYSRIQSYVPTVSGPHVLVVTGRTPRDFGGYSVKAVLQ